LALHGTEGEDGSVQALFEKNHIAFTGTGAKGSRLTFDKKLTKELARKHNLSLTEDLLLTAPTEASQKILLEQFFQTHQHIVLKPVANGSSVGLFIIHNHAQLTEAMNSIKFESGAYLAERFITGREITVGVMDRPDGEHIALPCSEVQVTQGRQFDYEGKYLGQGVVELTPAPITQEQTQSCQTLALTLHRVAGCYGYSRTDMILTDHGPVLLEINTLPGLSRASFIPQQLTAFGMSLKEFFALQITLAEKRNQGR
jgi:D-alanine-D-alanine ligase